MSKNGNLAFSNKSVRVAKVMWRAHRHIKLKLNFDGLFKMFQADYSLEEIAERAGVTRERVRQIYNKYFRTIFDGQSLRNRRFRCTTRNRLTKARESGLELLKKPVMRAIVEEARRAGCTVKTLCMSRDSTSYDAMIKSTVLLINGYRCSIHRITALSKTNPKQKSFYARTMICRGVVCRVDAFVVHTILPGFPEHMFIIPSSVLQTAYFGSPNGKNRKTFSLPTEKFTGRKRRPPLIDAWKYKNAWRLLSPKIQREPALS